MTRILVLGANGFIGRRILATAVRLYGAQAVLAGVRRPADFSAIAPDIEQRLIDVLDENAPSDAVKGATHVVNSVMGSRDAILGSTRLATALIAGGEVERAVHLSSIAVFGAVEGVIGENHPFGVPSDGYAATKIEAEKRFSVETADRGVILRPGLVFGAGSILWTTRIAQLLRAGRLGPMGNAGEGTCNLVHVDDVADAAVAACFSTAAGGRAIHLVASPVPDWNGYLRDFADALEISARPISPARLYAERLLAYPFTALARLGLPAPAPITPGLARLFAQKIYFESSAPGLLLPGWRNYRQCLAEAAASCHIPD